MRAIVSRRVEAVATDETALAEAAGVPVRIVAGEPSNLKVTTMTDLKAAEARAGAPAGVRVGTGYDLHRLSEGRPLILGGVTVPSEEGLAGHSDADVLAHAITDAVPGAVARGDIGRHFPDTDPRWKGASSMTMLAHAVTLAGETGFDVVNVDAVVIAERPKLAPHLGAIRASLAAVFDVEKLAWVNRHYLRAAGPATLAALALPHFASASFVRRDTAEARAYLADVMPLASGSVDRLEQMPSRLAFLFHFEPARSCTHAEVQAVLNEAGAHDVIAALARELAAAPRLDRELFRAAAGRVKDATGRKGRHLFHPIRVALTGEAGGPELDLAVPAIERGAELPGDSGLAPILGCRERAALFARWLEGSAE